MKNPKQHSSRSDDLYLTIGNDGENIKISNYWGSATEQNKIFFISVNAGAYRLLWPRCRRPQLSEMRTAKEVVTYLFPGRRPGTRLSETAGWRAIKRAFLTAGLTGAPLEIGTHTLRKTFARLIYAALGHDLVRTSYAMRHASVATTIKYLSFEEAEVDSAIINIRV